MNQSVRFILAVLLMIAVVVVTNLLFPPVPRTPVATADTTAAVTATAPPAAQTPAAPAAQPAQQQPTPAMTAATRADTVIVESPLYRFAFSSQGAALVSAEMLNFKSFTRDGPVQLAGRTPGGLLSHNSVSSSCNCS